MQGAKARQNNNKKNAMTKSKINLILATYPMKNFLGFPWPRRPSAPFPQLSSSPCAERANQTQRLNRYITFTSSHVRYSSSLPLERGWLEAVFPQHSQNCLYIYNKECTQCTFILLSLGDPLASRLGSAVDPLAISSVICTFFFFFSGTFSKFFHRLLCRMAHIAYLVDC